MKLIHGPPPVQPGPAALDGVKRISSVSAQTFIPDILSYIFLLCLPQDRYLNPMLNEAPINVSQVCQTWRDIALSTLQLWSQPCITIQPYAQSVPEYTLPLLSEWLRRSGTADVKISVDYARSSDETRDFRRERYLQTVTSTDIDSLFSEISKHWERTKSLTIRLPEDYLTDSVITLICTKMLALDTLDLLFYLTGSGGGGALYHRRNGCFPPSLDQRFSELFAGLKELSINSGGTVAFRLPSEGHPACSMLKKLSLPQCPSTADNVILFLKGCPQLGELKFSPPNTWGGISGPGFNPNLLTTTFTSIRVLDISGGFGEYTFMVGNLLDRLHLPQLRKLLITFEEKKYVSNQSWPQLAHFLKKSVPPLESLTLVNDWMSDAEVLRCLGLLPALRDLKIRFRQKIADALCASMPGNAPNTKAVARLCPMLKLIEFNDSMNTEKATRMSKRIMKLRSSS